jgi:hypothetical protein
MGVKISELPGTNTAADGDLFIISGSQTKAITYEALLAQLRADMGTDEKTVNIEWNGLNVKVTKTGPLLAVAIGGRTNVTLATNGAWVTIRDYSADGFLPSTEIIGYCEISGTQAGRYRFTTAGVLQIGYTRSRTDNSAQDVPSGNLVNITFCGAV